MPELICACATTDGSCTAAVVVDSELKCKRLTDALEIAMRAGWTPPTLSWARARCYPTELKLRALGMIAEGVLPGAAAKAVGIKTRTVHSWMASAGVRSAASTPARRAHMERVRKAKKP